MVFVSSACETNTQGNQRRRMVWKVIEDGDGGFPEKQNPIFKKNK